MFGVPTEHFEGVKTILCAYDDLIAEIKVSKGTMVNVYSEFTEEIPANFFYLRLNGDSTNSSAVAKQFAESLAKALEMYMNCTSPKILIFDREFI